MNGKVVQCNACFAKNSVSETAGEASPKCRSCGARLPNRLQVASGEGGLALTGVWWLWAIFVPVLLGVSVAMPPIGLLLIIIVLFQIAKVGTTKEGESVQDKEPTKDREPVPAARGQKPPTDTVVELQPSVQNKEPKIESTLEELIDIDPVVLDDALSHLKNEVGSEGFVGEVRQGESREREKRELENAQARSSESTQDASDLVRKFKEFFPDDIDELKVTDSNKFRAWFDVDPLANNDAVRDFLSSDERNTDSRETRERIRADILSVVIEASEATDSEGNPRYGFKLELLRRVSYLPYCQSCGVVISHEEVLSISRALRTQGDAQPHLNHARIALKKVVCAEEKVRNGEESKEE